MGPTKDITGMLPPELAKLLRDDDAVRDMLTILAEAQPALDAARKNPATDKSLRDAFNEVSGLLPLVKSIVEKKGKVSLGDAMRLGSLAMNQAKYKALGETLTDAFKAGDPAIVGLAQSMVENKKLIDAAKRVAPKVLPPQVQPLVQDKAVAADFLVVLTEVEKAVDAARKDPATDKSLTEAFNDVAAITAIVHTYLNTGSVSPDLMMELSLNLDKYKKSGETLSAAYDAGDATVIKLAQTIKKNENVLGALKRVVPKTHGTLFRLEQDADGQGYAVELLSGNAMKFPLDKADYEEIRSALAPAKNIPKTDPPKGPSV